ncbi:aromatic ring-hydroxylating oxygenase subunit alpha [Streptomyces botrytidirepellens]|uniref:Aromatic ring-hydroxylating dioxygenase subunit alpha n=1 Tax=Streptomyces botrytidirepellens TaxID=2486417 RepID=A0A3M8VYL6_9ACTN|nr:aromatic ring-hydroxylating dioxygenase subunit alpha [Streptomyces botrytidirepellens]RNG21619.1 aromatic ring-hydroxylating dioxygenase subunit alpha [Streptomyces botrytidirepellens]
MTDLPSDLRETLALPGLKDGWIDRNIFHDPRIYDLELERIFKRCWLFLAHTSQLSDPGSYITTLMGRDNVIVVRDQDGQIRAYLNTCPHRGNLLVRPDRGSSNSFICPYHRWTFSLDGKLINMHEKEAFERSPGFDASQLGLRPVAQVATYKGLVFGTLDEEAPSLDEYFGGFTFLLDALLDNDPGGTEFLPGSVRSIIHCNWKEGPLNFVCDALHAQPTHVSGSRAMLPRQVPRLGAPDAKSYQARVNGHGWEWSEEYPLGNAATLNAPSVMEYLRQRQKQFEQRLGLDRAKMVAALSSANAFPHASFLPGVNSIRVWQPMGPHRTLLQTFVLVNRNAPKEVKRAWRTGNQLTFNVTGTFEPDDVANWEGVNVSHNGPASRSHPLYGGLAMGTRTTHPGFPKDLNLEVSAGQISDENFRGYLQRYSELMLSPTWPRAENRRSAAQAHDQSSSEKEGR